MSHFPDKPPRPGAPVADDDPAQAIRRFTAASTPRVCEDLAGELLASAPLSGQRVAGIAGRFRSPEVRGAVVELLELWRRAPECTPPQLLAGALCAASAAAACIPWGEPVGAGVKRAGTSRGCAAAH